ncbi:hypothetical protein [Psychrobacter sp. I-STPA6b]|uniref:hypothetical protein n=1 Tax=Psychrobacter sp. I-STPA6b TaxID=2585718 RepID=UPI001D0CD1EE|nr:hypothetical protein [Psychrobacter sp. I-STPA6b]
MGKTINIKNKAEYTRNPELEQQTLNRIVDDYMKANNIPDSERPKLIKDCLERLNKASGD